MKNPLPAWALPVTALAAVALLAGVVWFGLGRGAPQPGPDMEVRPGMYNLHEEISKAESRRSAAQTK